MGDGASHLHLLCSGHGPACSGPVSKVSKGTGIKVTESQAASLIRFAGTTARQPLRRHFDNNIQHLLKLAVVGMGWSQTTLILHGNFGTAGVRLQ